MRMAITAEQRAQILRYFHVEGWRAGTIARQLGLHHDTVDRALSEAGLPKVERARRPSMIDPFVPFIIQTLTQFPSLTASRLYTMVKARGYTGAADHFRHQIAHYRPRPIPEAYHRLRTLPGEQAQCDWAHMGQLEIGRARRTLMAFVIVLSWSRQLFLRFYPDARTAYFLDGHQAAFTEWNAVPRVCLYDNLKSAVLERRGDAIRFNPKLLDFAAHYRFEPRPVAVARGNEKGRVERQISYIRTAFFAARQWRDLDDLNEQALAWCRGASADRPCPEQRSMSVREAFAEEKPSLLSLPDNPYPCDDRVEVSVGKTPYVRYDLNDYTIPHTFVRRTVSVVANLKHVRVLADGEVIATHRRSFDKDEQIELPEHIEALTAVKARARQHRHTDRLASAVPASRELLTQAAQRGYPLRSLTAELIDLLDHYGAQELQAAITEALERGVPHPNAIRLSLERRRDERQLPPPLALTLPADRRIRDLVVRPHDLTDYDPQTPESDDDADESE